MDTLWNFLTLSRGGAFDSLYCPEGRVFVLNDCPGGRVLAPFKSCPGGLSRGVVIDEIDTCISFGLVRPLTLSPRIASPVTAFQIYIYIRKWIPYVVKAIENGFMAKHVTRRFCNVF